MKTIVTENHTFQILVNGSEIGNGTVVINSLPSNKMKIENKKVYISPMSITVSGYLDANIQQSVPMECIINGSSEKNKLNKKSLILDGDFVDVNISGVHPITGVPVPIYPITIKVIANETKVEVN